MDIEPVDLRRVAHPDRPREACGDDLVVEPRPLGAGQQLRVSEPPQPVSRTEHDRRRHHRPRQTPATDLVDARDPAEPAPTQLVLDGSPSHGSCAPARPGEARHRPHQQPSSGPGSGASHEASARSLKQDAGEALQLLLSPASCLLSPRDLGRRSPFLAETRRTPTQRAQEVELGSPHPRRAPNLDLGDGGRV